MSDQPITVDFHQNPFRRGMIPTPAGAMPLRKRTSRGMVNLAAWDARVAADNAAAGTQSISAEGATTTLVQMLDTTAAEKQLADITATKTAAEPGDETPTGPAPVPARPSDPDADASNQGTPAARMSKGAILEDSQPRRNTAVEIPSHNFDPAKVAAAKAMLAAEEAAAAAQPGDPEILADDDDEDAPVPDVAPAATPAVETPATAIVEQTTTPPAFIPPPPATKSARNRTNR